MDTANAQFLSQINFKTTRVSGISGVSFPSHAGRQHSNADSSFEEMLQEKKKKLREEAPETYENELSTVNLEKYNGKMMGYSNRAIIAYYSLTQPQTDLKG